jgi:adhesin transport system outer membrane protein
LANEKSLLTHTKLRDQVRRRLAEGVSAQSDLVLALGRLDAITAEVTAGRTQRDMALTRLGQLLGKPVTDDSLVGTLAAPHALAQGPQALLTQALEQSPAVQKAQAQARVAQAVVGERRADLSPELYARLDRQYGNFNLPNGAPQTRLFIGLSTRFGAGLSALSNVEAARIQHEAAVVDIEAQSRAVSEQVLSDHALVVSSASRLDSIRASLRSAEEVSSSYDRQFLAGRKSWLDVMNAARELAQTETQIADLLSTQMVVSWRLNFYTQGLSAVTSNTP